MKFRNAITAEFGRRNISVPSYTNDAVTDKPIRAVHVQELRNALENVKTATYTDNPIQANITVVKTDHFNQIGALINLLEASPSVGGSSSCNSGCIGLCVSCSGTCTGGCISCVSCSGTCTGGCFASCYASCSGSCDGCSGCSNCSNGCAQGCGGGCTGNCTAGCANWCAAGCSGTCVGCSNQCTSTNYIY